MSNATNPKWSRVVLAVLAALWTAGSCSKERKEGQEADTAPQQRRGAARTPARAASPRARSLPSVQQLLQEVEQAKSLPGKYPDQKAFLQHALQVLGRWVDALVDLSQAGRRQEADRLAEAVSRLVAESWGPRRFPPDQYDSFRRDKFEVRGHTVIAAQFFRPLELKAADGSKVWRYYRFSVYVRAPTQRIHYRIGRRYFVEAILPKGAKERRYRIVLEQGGTAKVVAELGTKLPGYWELRRKVYSLVEEAKARGEF